MVIFNEMAMAILKFLASLHVVSKLWWLIDVNSGLSGEFNGDV